MSFIFAPKQVEPVVTVVAEAATIAHYLDSNNLGVSFDETIGDNGGLVAEAGTIVLSAEEREALDAKANAYRDSIRASVLSSILSK